MAKTFHHHITGNFHLKVNRLYRIVRVFRPVVSGKINDKSEERIIISDFFKGKDFPKYLVLLPTKWEVGVSYNLERISFKPGTHLPKD